jgi:hypothetical protein
MLHAAMHFKLEESLLSLSHLLSSHSAFVHLWLSCILPFTRPPIGTGIATFRSSFKVRILNDLLKRAENEVFNTGVHVVSSGKIRDFINITKHKLTQ